MMIPSGYSKIATEHGPFIDDVLIKTSIFSGFSMAMAMLKNQRVTLVSYTENIKDVWDIHGPDMSQHKPSVARTGAMNGVSHLTIDMNDTE